MDNIVFPPMDSPVGLEDLIFVNNDNEATVFPNPSTGLYRLRIESESTDYEIQVLNPQGKVVLSEKAYSSAGMLDHEIDMTGNPPGVYFIKVSGESESWFLKVIRM